MFYSKMMCHSLLAFCRFIVTRNPDLRTSEGWKFHLQPVYMGALTADELILRDTAGAHTGLY